MWQTKGRQRAEEASPQEAGQDCGDMGEGGVQEIGVAWRFPAPPCSCPAPPPCSHSSLQNPLRPDPNGPDPTRPRAVICDGCREQHAMLVSQQYQALNRKVADAGAAGANVYLNRSVLTARQRLDMALAWPFPNCPAVGVSQ